MDDEAVREQVATVEQLLEQLESSGDETALQAVQVLLDLYGEALARIVESMGDELPPGLLDDELVSRLLILHELHPVPLEERVTRALAEATPFLQSQGAGAELVDAEDGVVRVALSMAQTNGRTSSPQAIERALEGAIERAAPDAEAIEIEGPAATGSGIRLPMARSRGDA